VPFCLNCRLEALLRGALASDEVIRRPGTAHDDFHAGQMPGRHLVAILILLHFFVIDQVGDVDEHAAGIDLAAADILVQRIENFVDLN